MSCHIKSFLHARLGDQLAANIFALLKNIPQLDWILETVSTFQPKKQRYSQIKSDSTNLFNLK